MIRLWVSISRDKIQFRRDYRDSNGNIISLVRNYKTTPERIVRVVYASNKYTHYKG